MEEEGLYIVGYPPLPSWSEGFRDTVGLLRSHLHSFTFALAYVLGKVFTHTPGQFWGAQSSSQTGRIGWAPCGISTEWER